MAMGKKNGGIFLSFFYKKNHWYTTPLMVNFNGQKNETSGFEDRLAVLSLYRHGDDCCPLHMHHVHHPGLRPSLLRQEWVVRPSRQKYDGQSERETSCLIEVKIIMSILTVASCFLLNRTQNPTLLAVSVFILVSWPNRNFHKKMALFWCRLKV